MRGSGYQEIAELAGRGDEIPPAARIIAVADSFDAMTTNRPYRRALAPEEAIADLRRGAGTLFDPAIVDAFVATWTEHPAGPKPEYLPEYLSPLLAGSG